MSETISWDWPAMLAQFRRLGGVAENIEQRVGPYGNGLFPIDPEQPIEIAIPARLLIDADHLVLEGDDLVVSPAAKAAPEVSHFIARYQKHFSWGADGRKGVEAFESALKTLPEALLQRLQQLHLLNLTNRHKGVWTEVLRQRFLQSRRINYHGRKVSMPIIELINHSPRSPGYLINDGIQFKGTFDGEITVNYSPASDALLRFFTYGFASAEPGAYSLPMHLKLGDGRTVHVGYNIAEVTLIDKLAVPKVVTEGQRTRLSHLRLGLERAPRMPRTLLRKALPDWPVALVDEVFERVRSSNLLALTELLELAEGADTAIAREFRRAIRYQLKALAHCYGVRAD